MKPKFNNKYVSIGIIAFLVIASSIVFFFLFFQVESFKNYFSEMISILAPIIYGLIIAYLLTPLINFFERRILYPFELRNKNTISIKRKKMYRITSVVITIVVIAGLMTVLIKMVVPQVVVSLRRIGTQFPYYLEALQSWSNKLLKDNADIINNLGNLVNVDDKDVVNFFNNNIIPNIQESLKGISTGVLSAVTSVWNLVIGLIISIYVVLNKELFAAQSKKIVYALFNLERANQLIKDIRFVSETFIGFLSGKIIDSLIIGILCFVGLSILKIPYALLISVIIGITNIIPFFGPFIGAIPSALLVLMVDPLKCLYFVIFVLILQQVDGNIIGPLILGDSTGLSGFWVIFSITVFGGLWGFLGMIIGIPFFAVVYALIKRHIERRLRNKNLPQDTNYYKPLKSIDENGERIDLYESIDINYKRKEKTKKESRMSLSDIKMKKTAESSDDSVILESSDKE